MVCLADARKGDTVKGFADRSMRAYIGTRYRNRRQVEVASSTNDDKSLSPLRRSKVGEVDDPHGEVIVGVGCSHLHSARRAFQGGTNKRPRLAGIRAEQTF